MAKMVDNDVIDASALRHFFCAAQKQLETASIQASSTY